MPAYKDKTTGSWNVQFYYKDWTGKNRKKYIRGCTTKKDAQEYENSFKSQKAPCIDMLFGEFWVVYTNDVRQEQEIKELNCELEKVLVRMRGGEEKKSILDDIQKCSDEEIQLLLINVDNLTLGLRRRRW